MTQRRGILLRHAGGQQHGGARRLWHHGNFLTTLRYLYFRLFSYYYVCLVFCSFGLSLVILATSL